MSRENVELVRALFPQPGTDVIPLFRDEDTFARMRERLQPFVTDDFQSVFVFPGQARTSTGLEGLRRNWLDWLAPWATYRTTLDELIDAGDRVVVFFRDRGRREGMDLEVDLVGAEIWTIRDGKVARIEDYADRREALAAAGLPGDVQTSS